MKRNDGELHELQQQQHATIRVSVTVDATVTMPVPADATREELDAAAQRFALELLNDAGDDADQVITAHVLSVGEPTEGAVRVSPLLASDLRPPVALGAK